ncbi:D-beta-hydroxybutyrate dehydrogenase, mitochondrial-like [Saccoglossus kowalevskii]|uniref:D-beta-hydroxybutyrate dehydrogenase, mitochondrial-like n=1 Tax=Saccoglossus kowalevskii TaxID=10224 RepID=A0ABM0GNE3_SACKO|nr:PREDICTED: D-beta-hydroxybutyrate dehydrogenase, mitochondrial-like [Saccoglossus kowalevskii]
MASNSSTMWFGGFLLIAFSFVALLTRDDCCSICLPVIMSVIGGAMLLVSRPGKRVDPRNKAILVTGCDRGFGLSIAKHFYSLGFEVFAGCLFKDNGGDGAVELEKMGSNRMHVLQLDVADDEQVKMAVKCVKELTGERGLWALVNNAGLSTYGHVEWCTMETYKQIADVTLWGVVRTTKAFLPLLRKSKGRVINVSSYLGLFSPPGRSAYCICKRGIEAFSDSLRLEMRPFHVPVSVIEPANFIRATGLYTEDSVRKISEKLWREMEPNVKEDYGKETFDSAVEKMRTFCSSGHLSQDMVLDTYEDALLAQHPKVRYLVGNWKEKTKTFILYHLPTWLGDWLYW